MKILFLATALAPDFYTFDGEKIIAHFEGGTATFDLTSFPPGAVFTGADELPTTADAIRNVVRDPVTEELTVTLAQRVIAGQYPLMRASWGASPIMDVSEYEKDTCYVVPTAMLGVPDYEIAQGVDVAGTRGWTVRKKEPTNG